MATDFEPTEEVLVGLTVAAAQLEVVVITTGETSEDDFQISVDKGVTGQPPYHLTVIRMRPDQGKMMPTPTQLRFDRSRLGLEGAIELVVTNRFGTISQGQ